MKIVLFEDNREYWIAISKLLKERGFDVEPILVVRGDRLENLARYIKNETPDLIIADEELPGFKGHQVLKQVGGDFYRPGMPGGNPRVISISSDPTKEMLELVGASFKDKRYLTDSNNQQFRDEAKQELIEKIQGCIERIN